MTPDELDGLDQQIDELRDEVRRLQDKLNQFQHASPSPAHPQEGVDRYNHEGVVGTFRAREEKLLGDEGVWLRLRKHPYYSLIILLLASGLAGGGYWAWNYIDSYESTSDARIGGLISLISSRVTRAVSRVFVHDNQSVKLGQPLVALNSRDYKLLVERARSVRDEAKAGAEAARHQYNATLAKYNEALKAKANTPILSAARDMADAAHSVLTAKMAAEHAAEAALDQAQLRVVYTDIFAPVAGVVAKRSVTVGEWVQPSQRLLAIVQTDDLWVTANFKETQLRRIHPGERVTIHVDAPDRDYRGFVQSIAPATKSEFSLLPPENAAGNFVKVVQRVEVRILFSAGQDLQGLKPGMSLEPKIWVNGH